MARSRARLGPAWASAALVGNRRAGYLPLMFEELQRIFRKSMMAFRAELGRREPEDQVAELLSAMRKEWVAARAEVSSLADALERARAGVAREQELLAQCERRGRAAQGIGDAETARVAAEFAARHRERIRVLEQKVAATQAEHALRVNEVEEMKKRYQEADANRFALLAELRRGQNQARIRTVADDVEGTFADWGRMEEKVRDQEAYAAALEELETDAPPPPRSGTGSRAEVDERLQELKRRMGKE